MSKPAVNLVAVLLTCVGLVSLVGCAATNKAPRTVGEWMELDQVKP